MDSVAEFKASVPFVLDKDGVAYKVTELTLFERYLRFIVHAVSNEGIETAQLDMTDAQIINFSTDRSPFAGATAYIFDGLLTKSSIHIGEDWTVTFTLRNSRRVSLNNSELIASEPFHNPAVIRLWEEMYKRPPGVFVEVGGRGDTSIGLRNRMLAGWKYISVDIHPGPNVDLEGDAHRLSEVIEPGTVDIYYSSSTYEHLAQPWLAVLEANKVLKLHGLAFTDVPQSFPLHAKPWDYWRYAPYTWPHLFSHAAGFEVMEIGTYCECKIVPTVMRDWNNRQVALEGGGWLGTACLARKIVDTTLEWKGYTPETDTAYPFVSDLKYHKT